MKWVKSILSTLHSFLAISERNTYIVAKIRNQCDLIIRKRFAAKHMEPSTNGEYKLLEAISPFCNIYFDVGANKGEWTNFILSNTHSAICKFYLFEPGAKAFSFLQKRFVNNELVSIKNLALSNFDGVLDFYEEENGGEMSSAVLGWANNNTTSIQVPCTTIDQEINTGNISYIHYLKIDVEGFDLKVIEGASKAIKAQKIGFIQFEYNSCWFDTGSSLSRAYQIFNANQYKTYIIRPKGLLKYDVNIYGDFYSFSNFLAVAPANHKLIQELIL